MKINFDKTISPEMFGKVDKTKLLKFGYIAAVCLCGALLRKKLFPYFSHDMVVFLLKWLNYFRDNGGFHAVGDKVGDYSPLYYYYLALLSYFKGLQGHIGIKLLSVIFDYIMAFYVYRIVKLEKGDNSASPLIAFSAALFLPTVILDSAAWGQCDIIYTCFLVMCVYYILKGNDRKAMIMLGVSFALKLQAIFLAPLVGILLFKKKIRFRTLLYIPVIYVISIIPAIIAGGDPVRLLTVYLHQSGEYSEICMSLPNAWALLSGLDSATSSIAGSAGIYLAGGGVLTLMYYYITKDIKLTRSAVTALALISVFGVPFLLPFMHERYFFPAEVFFLIFAFYFKEKAWVVLTSQFCSVQSLATFLFDMESLDIRLLALIELVNIAVVFFTLEKELASPRGSEIKMIFENNDRKRHK